MKHRGTLRTAVGLPVLREMTGSDATVRIVVALLGLDASDFSVRCGSVLTLMSDLAKQGDLGSISDAFAAAVAVSARDADALARAVPGKILNGYFYLYRKGPAASLNEWASRNAGWSETVQIALGHREGFVSAVQAIDRRIDQELAGRL